MAPPSLDHLVIACATLEQGAAWLRERLGVDAQPGGVHARMGTHNQLLRLGSREYLEILAPNPDAKDLVGPRWFGFDDAATRARLEVSPFLLTWVARVDDLDAAVTRIPELGSVREFERGSYRWKLAMPAGALLFEGEAPILIRWEGAAHPCDRLEDRGSRLRSLTLTHPMGDALRAMLDALDLSRVARVQTGPARIQAVVTSPRGEIDLGIQ